MKRIPPHAPLLIAALAAATLLACNNDPLGSDTPYYVVPITSTPLAGTAGRTLTDTLVVEVRTADGHPVPGAKVTWSLPNGGSMVVQLANADNRLTGTADSHGRNSAVWKLGVGEGEQVAMAAAGFGESATFTASATVLHARQVTVGDGYACAVLLDQRPVCWGSNYTGQLGTGDSTGYFTPVPVAPVGLTAVLEIRATPGGLTCARDMAGDVWCWGRNVSGEAGPAAAQPIQPTPVRVAGAEGAVSVSLATPIQGHACAALAAGGVVCWGTNRGGQLGTGDTASSASPRTVVGSGSFTGVFAGDNRTCALDINGEAWCWGDAKDGELAPLPSQVFTTPTQPVPGFRYSSLAVGAYAVCGIELSGRASCFGLDFGSFGHLPVSELQPGDPPVRADLNENLAQLVSDGWNGFYARSRYGLGYAWGETGCCDVFTLPPQMITPSIRVEDIAAGNPNYCVLSETGGIFCDRTNRWGEGREETLAGVPDIVTP